MSQEEAAAYITEQLKRRGWSKRELARQARVSLSSVVRATDPNAEIAANFDVLNAIALALRIPPQTLLIKAGLLPREPEQTMMSRHLVRTYEQLPTEHQRMLISFCDFLFTQRTNLFDVPSRRDEDIELDEDQEPGPRERSSQP